MLAVIAATRAGVGRRNKSGWGENENQVTMMAAAISLHRGQAADNATRGGRQTMCLTLNLNVFFN